MVLGPTLTVWLLPTRTLLRYKLRRNSIPWAFALLVPSRPLRKDSQWRGLQRVVLPAGKGDRKALLAKDADGVQLLATVWVDRDRRYFISTCSSTAPAPNIERRRWRQRDQTPNADPVLEEVIIPQPQVTQMYHAGAGKIDEHNRDRQEYLDLEKKIRVMQWDKRANLSIFAMTVVDAWKLCQGCAPGTRIGGARTFFEELLTDLIDNDYDKRSLRKRRCRRYRIRGKSYWRAPVSCYGETSNRSHSNEAQEGEEPKPSPAGTVYDV